jgi:succinoglycan biosynthesis transport protein ExoP
VIAQDAELADAIQETSVENLWILPCGPLPPDPAELLTSPKFYELIQVLREQYDYVLIDTAPLLAVTDPCAVAPRVDGVILTMRLTKNGRPQADRAKEILTSLNAKVLGVVVNGVPKSRDGSYGQYQYGAGYSQSYLDQNSTRTENKKRSEVSRRELPSNATSRM